jgi:iron complex transport system permease protein
MTVMALLAFVMIVASMLLGAGGFGAADVLGSVRRWLCGLPLSDDDHFVLMIVGTVRAPRVVLAALVGVSLAAAGVISQGLFRNPLADPSILGATSGASVVAASVIYLGGTMVAWWMVPVAAFAGALGAMALVVVVMAHLGGWALEMLLLAGFALNALLAAMTSLVVSLSLEDYQRTPALMHWMMGSLGAKSFEHLALAAVPCVVGMVMGWRLLSRMDVLALGEEVASTLSVNVFRLKIGSVVAVSLLVGAAVCVAGAIPFVGLVVPHITRLLLTARHRVLFFWSALNGMTLVLAADLAARTLRAPQEVQVGVIIALLGAPFFLWLLIRRQSDRAGGAA